MRTFRSIMVLGAAVLLGVLSGARAQGQEWTMVNGDTVHIDACASTDGVIYDNGGPNGSYSNSFTGWVVIESGNGVSIALNGEYALEGCCDYLTVWDGNPSTGTQLFHNCGSGTLNLTASSGRMTIQFSTDGSVTNSGFALTWSRDGIASTCTGNVGTLTASNIGTTTASLAWTGSGTLKLNYGEGERTVSGGSATLTGLNPNTFYTAELYAESDAGNPCCMAKASFRTACGLMRAPMVERFDDLEVGEMPPCWSMGKNFDDESLFPTVSSEAHRSGTQSLRLSSGGNTTSTHFGMAMGPKMSEEMSLLTVHLSLRSNMSNAKVEVGVCDTVSSLYSYYGFTPLDTLTVSTSGTWYDYTVPLTAYTGNGCRVALRMVQGLQPGGSCIVYIDNVIVEKCGVDSLRVFNRGHDELTLSWSLTGLPTVDLTVSGGGTLTTYSGVSSPYRITGLEPGTVYTLTLTPHCDGIYGVAKSKQGTTLGANTMELHYCQDFEAGWPGDWYRPETYGSHPQRDNNSGYCMRMYYYYGSGNTAVMPRLAVSPTEVKLRLQMRPQSSGSGLVVGVMDYPNEMGSFTPVDTLVNPSTSYRYFTVDFSNYTGSGRYLALRTYSPTSNNQYIYVDNINVGRCLLEGVSVTNIGAHSLELRWTQADGNFQGDSVVVEYGAPGFADGEGARVAVAVRGATMETAGGKQRLVVDGLQADANYEFRLHGQCDNITSDCGTTTVSVHTLPHDFEVPFCTDFEGETHGTAPMGWTRTSVYSSEPCVMNDRTTHSGVGVLSLYANGDLTRGHSTIALPMINSDNMGELIVSFYAYSNKNSNRILEVGVMDDPNDESTFVPVDTVTPSYNAWGQHICHLTGYSGNGRYIAFRWYYTDCNGCNYLCYVDDLTVDTGIVTSYSLYSVRSDGAMVDWSTEGNVGSVSLRLIADDDTTTVANITHSYPISGLEPGMTYRYELDYGQCLPIGGTFTTRSEAMRADWCYDFETGYDNGRYEGWSYPLAYGTGSGNYYRGSHALYVQSYGINSTAAVTPYIEETDYTGLRLNFMAKMNGYGHLVVGLLSDPRDTAGLVPLDTLTERDNVWRRYEVDLSGHEGDGHHIVFWMANRNELGCWSCNSYCDLDDLRLSRGNEITDRSYTSTATTADITWSTTAATDRVRVVLQLEDENVFDSIADASDGGCHIEGLLAGSTYRFILEALKNGQPTGCDMESTTLSTLSHDVSNGYCERCDGNWTVMPEGWSWLQQNGQQPWYSGPTDRFGRREWPIPLRAQSPAEAYTMAIAPQATVALNTLTAGFGAWYNSEDGEMAAYVVAGIMTDPTDASTFAALDTFYLTNYLQYFGVDLASYSGSGRYLAFKGMSLDGFDRTVYLTDIVLSPCLPTRLRATEVTDTSFNLHWQMLGSASTVRIVIDGVVDTTVSATASLCHIANLASEATYTVRVLGSCQEEDDCQWQTLKVSTLQQALDVPFCMTFTPVDYTQQSNIISLPRGWTRPYGNYYPHESSSHYRNGNSIRFNTYRCGNSSDRSSMAVSPYIPEGFNGNYLDFYLHNESCCNSLVVGTVSDPYDTTTFVAHDTLRHTQSWEHVSLSLANYAGHYLAFRFDTYSCNSGDAYLSDLALMHCPMPQASLSHQTDTSVWVHWTGSDPVWIEYAMGSDFAPGNGTRLQATTSPIVVGGLNSASSYTFHVWPQCGEESLECNYQTLTLTTMHPPVSIPYCHNFEGFGDWGYPDEWSRWTPEGTTCAVTSYAGHDDSRSLHLVASSVHSATAIVPILEPSSLCAQEMYVNFWARRWGGTPRLVIGIVDDYADTNSFTPYDTVVFEGEAWSHHTATLPSSALRGGRAAFRLLPGGDLLIDNLCVEKCVAANVEVVDITQHTATIVWEGYSVDTLVCEYGPQGFAQGTGQRIGITTSPYTITGLNANSEYNFIFRTVCHCPEDDGSVYPAGGGTGGNLWWNGYRWQPYVWADTIHYPGYSGGGGGGIVIGTSTQAEMLATPYCEDFDTFDVKGIPTGWRRIGGSQPGYPQIGREPVLSGARSLDLYTTTGYSNHIALPPVADPSRLILAFSAYTTNDEPQNRSLGVLSVGVMTDPDRGSTFVPIDTVAITRDRWGRHFVDLSAYSGEGHYIALRFTPKNSSYHIYLDNLYLGASAVTSATAQGVELAYSTIGSSEGVIVEWDDGNRATLTSSPSVVPGLVASQHYELTVRSFSLQDTQSLCHLQPIIVNPQMVLPYCENFNNADGMYADGWTVKNRYNDSYTCVAGGTMQFSMYSGTPDVFLLPPLAGNDSIGGLYISLQYHANDNNYYNWYYTYLDFGYLADTNNYNSFVTLATLHNNSAFATHFIQLPHSSANRLALRARSTSGWHIFDIDNLVVSRIPLPTSENLSSPNVGYATKQITWTAETFASHYQYEWGPAGFAQGTGTLAMSDSCTLTLTGLDPETDYDLYFIDSTGHYACTPFRFLSPSITAVPYCDDFEAYNNYQMPPGWSTYAQNTDGHPMVYDHHLDNAWGGTQMWIMPEFDVTPSQLTLHFLARAGYTTDRMIVGFVHDRTHPTDFIPYDTIQLSVTNQWVPVTVDLSRYTGDRRFVAFKFWGSYYFYIDNVVVEAIPPLTIAPASATQIAVNVDGTLPDALFVEIVPSGNLQGTGSIVRIDNSPFVIDGLTPEASYDIYARTDSLGITCAAPVSVAMPARVALPYCEEFSSYGDCYNCRPQEWHYNSSNDDQNYTVSSNNWSLRFYSYYYNSHYVYASLPDLDIENINQVSLELRYRFESSPCLAELGLLASPTDWNSFLPVDTLDYTSVNTWYTLQHNFRDYDGNRRFIAIRFKGAEYSYNYLYIDHLRIQACPLPRFSLSAYNTVKCEIDSAYTSADYWVRLVSTDTDTLLHVDSNPFFITDLPQQTEFSLSSQCDSITPSCFPATTITTGMVQSLPYCENFDSYGSCNDCRPTGWRTIIRHNDDRIYTTSGNNWSLRLYSYYYNTYPVTALLPDLAIDSLRHLSMQIRFRLESYSSTIEIGVMDGPDAANQFTPIRTYTNLSTNTWYVEDIDFSSYHGDGRFVAIRTYGNLYQDNYLFIDYLYLQPMPLVSLTMPAATTIIATVDSTLSPDYWLHYTLVGSNDTSHLHVTSTSYPLENLEVNSTYNLLTTPDSVATSCWPWRTITTSHPQGVPYCETFADYPSGSGYYPTGWKRFISDNSNSRHYIYNDYDADDHRDLYFYIKNTVCAYAVLPEMDIDIASGLFLRAKMWQQNSTNISQYWLEVGVMDDMNDTTTFQVIDTLQCTQSGRWEQFSTSFANYTGSGRFIALRTRCTTSNWRNIYLDQVEILNCDIPSDLKTALVTNNVAQLSGATASTGFFVEYGPSGFLQGNGTTEFVDILPFDIALDYETSYDFYFKCAADESTCLPKHTLTTRAAPIELPYCENFDSYNSNSLPDDWLKLRKPNEYYNDYYVYDDHYHTGNRSLRFYSYYSERHPYAILPELQVDSLSRLAISFWMRNSHYTYHSLELGTMSDPHDESTFVPLRQFRNTDNNVWQRMQAVLSGADIEANFLAFRFSTTNLNSYDGLYVDDLFIDTCGASDLMVSAIESESVTLDWQGTGSPTVTLQVIPQGGTVTEMTLDEATPPYSIAGLSPLTNYKIILSTTCGTSDGYCNTDYTDSVTFFTPAGGTGCIDPTNLTADYTTCFTGSFSNPYSNTGVIDHGYNNASSHHTVHYDPNERDPRTGNLLRTVPVGATASVRLGNWQVRRDNGTDALEAAAITYSLLVDTMAFDLLIMKYAAVMQDPMHAVSDQPRFTLELLDDQMQPIDSECGVADFRANQALGWNTYGDDENTILWKDWTTVGIDMSAYAGQTVYIRLTTYDCNEGSHYGYAYFTLECRRKSMTAEGCGNVASNIFTAPSGFAYRWYTNLDTSTYSNDQSINISSNNSVTYFCNLSFVDNPNCQFTMSAFAGTRFPLSLFDSVVTIHDCLFDLSFNNHSTISMDGINPVGSGEGVESAHWSFGNGTSSDNYHATVTYTQPGTYTVQLVTSIAGGACTDTIEKEITLAFPPTHPRIEGATDRCYGSPADTLVVLEASSWTPWNNDTIIEAPISDSTYTLNVTDSNGCAHTLSHTLHVNPVYYQNLSHTICDGASYAFGSQSLTDPGIYHQNLTTATYLCDSIVTLDLTVNPNTSETVSEEINETQLPYTFHSHLFTDSVTNYPIHIPNSFNCDSLITYNLSIIWNDKQTLLDSTLCHNMLPITWNGILMADTGTYSAHFSASHGEDSTVIMHLHTVPVYNDTIDHYICDNQQYSFEDSTYGGNDAGLHPHLLHTDIYGCDSLRVLRLEVRATTSGDTVANECDSFAWYGTTYTAGTDTPTHLSSNSAGCDSTTTLHLTIRYSSTSTVEETIVENQLPYTFNGQTFTDSTDLTLISIPNAVGCDSTISYTLHIDWNTGSRLDSNVCFNQLPITWNGEQFDTTAMNVTLMRTVVIPSTTGSDSTIIMRVHVRPIYNDTIDHSICDNESYVFEGTTYSGSTKTSLYSHLLQTNIYGCDSLRVLRLEVRATTSGDTVANECDSFAWYGTTYTAGTDTPTHLSSNSAGCDSTTTLHLTIRYSSTSTVEETIVENQLPYTFNGQTFTDSTDLTLISIPNAVGCDSTISYTLHIDWNTGSRLDSNVCFNQLPITWNGEQFDTNTASTVITRTVTIPSATGSDSTIIMRVHVRPIYNDTIDHSICDNQQYAFEDSTYGGDDAGLHPHLLQTDTYSCDSLRVLRLEVRATTSGDTVANECDSFAWYGTTYTAGTDTPTHLSTNSAGCDSTTTLHLTIRYSSAGTETDTIVENQLPYTYHDSTFADSISHVTVAFPNSVQCDSLVDYTLFVHWNVDTTLYDTLCNDALPHTWNQVTFDTADAVSQTSVLTRSTILTAHTGADSTVTMHLVVHPLYDHHTHAEICDNQQYTFGDSTFLGSNSSTVHLDSLRSVHGCDSLSTLHLTVHATFDHHTYDTICSNQSVTFTGESYNITGIYPHSLQSQHQCDSLSTLHLQVWPAYDIHTYDTVCDDSSRFFIDSAYTLTGTYPYFFFSSHACDSLQTLHLKVYPTYDLHLFDTIYDGDHYTFEGSVYDTTGIYPHLLAAVFGCDSLRTLHLQRNRRTYNDSTLCQNSLPLVWNGAVFTDKPHSGGMLTLSDSVHLTGLNGIDSLVVMTVHALDTSAYTDVLHACDSLLWQDGLSYNVSITSPTVTLANAAGCDSVVHLALTVDYTHAAVDHQQACDSLLWLDNRFYFADTLGPIDTISTVAGCDSIVTLDLTMHHATYEEAIDTFCFASTYTWRRFTVGEEDPVATTDLYLTDTLRTQHDCDSVLAIRLTQMAKPQLELGSSVDCQMMQYSLTLSTDMPYSRWWATPEDPSVDGIENSTLLFVAPEQTTDYHVLVDYRQDSLCPLNGHITLQPIEIPHAELKVNPEALTLNNMELDAYDISHEFESRVWYINWQQQSEGSRHLHYMAETSLDSVVVALSVYNGMCHDTAARVIPILKSSIFAPNVFTPVLETNNRFIIVAQGVIEADLYIYNREGLLVYRTDDIERGWDGRDLNGTPCIQGSYVWRLIYRAVDRPTSERSEVGTVLLLR